MLSIALLLLCQGDLPMAILESGKRVEASAVPDLGARHVETPFGLYDATLDPVVSIQDGLQDRELLAPLQALDQALWLQRISERGLLSLLAAAQPKSAAARESWMQELTSWGAHLDTLPSATDREQRSEQLWQALGKAKDAEQLLLTGALLREIPSSRDLPKRRIGLVALRHALASKDPELRRAAALIGAHQRNRDLERPLLASSLEDPVTGVRSAAALALEELDQQRALGLWTLSLWHGKSDQERQQAATHLGDFGSKEPAVAKALIHALASSGTGGAPRSYVFFGKQVTYIGDYDVEVASGSMIADPVVSVLTEGVSLQIRVISTQLAGRIATSLKQLTGQDFGTDREAWMRWYEKTYPAS